MRVETKRMLLGRSFLAAWLIACFSIAAGQTYPSLKKALTCGTFISLLDGSLKSQMVSFADVYKRQGEYLPLLLKTDGFLFF